MGSVIGRLAALLAAITFVGWSVAVVLVWLGETITTDVAVNIAPG